MDYRTSRWRLGALLTLLAVALHASALDTAYCSNQNTGSDSSPTFDNFQSNGLCHDACVGSYAFAILQGKNCWCSDYIPSNQVSTGKCSEECAGYPTDLCGSQASGLFGYIALNKKPAGTAGASSNAVKTSKTPAVTSTSAPLSSPKPTAPGSPVTSVFVVTQSGSVVTQTVTSMPSTPANALLGKEKSSKIAPGYIAAAVIASVAGIILLALALFWIWRRRQIAADDEKYAQNMRHTPDLDRNVSVHSKAGLLDSSFSSPTYPAASYPPTITTQFSTPHLNVSSSDGISPISAGDERRLSRPRLTDQRLNPDIFMRHENGSRSSIRTIEDNRDYGRLLKVMNPDAPRKSFS
jgi:cell wall integrity and stress response component